MIPHIVKEAAERFGDRAAVVEHPGASITYSDLDLRSTAAAATFRANGLSEGSVVGLTIRSGIDYLIHYIAAAKIGAITAGVNPSLSGPERAAILERLAPDLIVDVEYTLAHPSVDGSCGTVWLPELADDPERLVAIVFTSGTTGPPKGAVFRNRQLSAICDIDLGAGWRDRWGGGGPMLASTQFAHVGFMTKLPWYLRLGVTLHVLDRWTADGVLGVIAAERIETLGAVAPQLALMLRSPEIDRLDVSCVTSIIAGGAASPPGLVRAARDRFDAKYSIRYSSTESGGVGLATSFDADDDEALHSVGRPRPGIRVRIVGDHGRECDTGEVGDLLLSSPTMFDGYWHDPEATSATVIDGWLHTGDRACIDHNGLVRLAGRKKEMYIRGGYNVAPAEVEAVLSEHDAVAGLAIAPRADDVMGEIGVAVVVVAADKPAPDLAALRSFGSDHLAKWKLPEALVIVDELPLTAMQKLDRGALSRLVDPERSSTDLTTFPRSNKERS